VPRQYESAAIPPGAPESMSDRAGLPRIGANRRDVAWPAKSIAIHVQVALRNWLKSVNAPAAADEFPTLPLVWRLRLSLMMFGGILDVLESQPR
jgi:hypothetical protein